MPIRMNNPARPIASTQHMRRFLLNTWSVHEAHTEAYVFLCALDRQTERLITRGLKVLDLVKTLRSELNGLKAGERDIFFCPHAFFESSRKEKYALPTRYLHCDIDDADPEAFMPPPSILWETSPGRFQGLWVVDQPIAPAVAQANSKRLTYAHHGDKNGHSITKLLRVPGSVNTKPQYELPSVRLLRFDGKAQVRLSDLETNMATKSIAPKLNIVQPDNPVSYAEVLAIWRKYRKKMNRVAAMLMKHRRVHKADDRSGTIYCIIVGLYEAGATIDEIARVVSVSPYFQSKHGSKWKVLEEEITRCIASAEAKNGQ
jgi:hypothetical protein